MYQKELMEIYLSAVISEVERLPPWSPFCGHNRKKKLKIFVATSENKSGASKKGAKNIGV